MFVRCSNSSSDIFAAVYQNTRTVIDATQKETAIDQQQHSCETLICQRHQTILRLLSSAATASIRWRVRELYCPITYIKSFSISWFLHVTPTETSCVFPRSVLTRGIWNDPQNKQRLFPVKRFIFVMTTKVCIFFEVKYSKVNVYEFALHKRISVLINNLGNIHRACVIRSHSLCYCL